ncbi:MAG: hypothetical protein QG657_1533 [Acidobacteriota bacterium]|nr:hypothetical protein [Acidobacteriota bacterium]
MNKKLIALITVILFTFFNCISTHIEEVIPEKDIPRGKAPSLKILGVVTTSDKWIEFNGEPGRIVMNVIESEVADEPGKPVKRISIPLNEVKRVWLRKPRGFGSGVLLPIVGFFGLLAAIGIVGMALSDPFCPFIYSFDGNAYTLDAESLAGAVGPGFKRTEWKVLSSLAEVNHQYRLLAVNEVDAADYLDHVQLLAVDHPMGVIAAPGVSGAVHTITDPTAPLRAYDPEGNDLLPFVGNNDELYWQAEVEGQELPGAIESKTGLIFEFPRPKDAAEAKVIFKGCNSFWGAGVLKRHLAMYGKNAPAVLEEIETQGPAFVKIKDMLAEAEALSLQLRVETDDGWKIMGNIAGGSPLAPGTHVYPVDLSGVTGDMLRIKLIPPAASWMIDYIAVDYSGDLPVKVTKLRAVKPKTLAAQDGCYLKLSPQGASVGLIFDSPSRCPGMERTIILEISGYYDIPLDL